MTASGHQAGGYVSVEVARRLRAECGDFDTVARAGGDEFTVLLQDNERVAEHAPIATLRSAVNRPTEYNGISILPVLMQPSLKGNKWTSSMNEMQ